MKQISYIIIGILCLAWCSASAEVTDTCVRLDYVMGGTVKSPNISLMRTKLRAGNALTHRGDQRPYWKGNGQITVTQGRDTVYRESFSSLYNEWLTQGDTIARAFENTYYIPRLQSPAEVSLTLTDARGEIIAEHRSTVDPADILIARPQSVPFAVDTIWSGSYEGPQIEVALLPEGFTEAEMDTFINYCHKTVDAIFSHEPFGELRDRFRFVAVRVSSHDSGVSVPKEGKWRETPFGSHFSTFYSDRYLTTPATFAVHDALQGTNAQHIIILANTDTYGGGGIYNAYTLTTTGHKNFLPVVVHEFGHSFGGLADEYFYENDVFSEMYPVDVEPWEPNISTLVRFADKWEHLLAPGTPVPTPAANAETYPVGVYEGGGYATKGVFRPAYNCRMRTNAAEGFCPACQDAIRRLILYYTAK